MEKLEMKSMDQMEIHLELFKSHFPGVITEIKDSNGRIKKGINVEYLKKLLSIEASDELECYELNWIGKKAAIRESNMPTHKSLCPGFTESKDWSTTGNLYIEGDNLDALKLLQKSYQNSIKMIYIDPPYNTGNGLIYRDNYSLIPGEQQKQPDNYFDGKKRSESHAALHSGWCSMMYPRLKLARNLMTDDGIIFISIDENELDNLKKICNEIFGETNFITIIGLEITKTQGMKVKAAREGSIVKNYEYILCYAKNTSNKKIVKNILFDRNEGYDTHFSYVIEKVNGTYVIRKLVDVLAENREIYEEFKRYNLIGGNRKIHINALEKAISVSGRIREYIYNHISKNIYQEMACAINIDEKTEARLDSEQIVEYNGYLLTKSSGGKLRQYGSLAQTLNRNDEYKSEYGRVTIRGNLWKGFYSDMMNVAKEGEVEYKNGKKPVRLIYQLAKWIGVADGDIVLDFFSGSATTAHAIMELNAADQGRRKYIMMQMNENLDESLKTAAGENRKTIQKTIRFLDSIHRPHFLSELGKHRIQVSGEGIIERCRKEKKKKGLHEEVNLDMGFRVFRVSNLNIVDGYREQKEDQEHAAETASSLRFNTRSTDPVQNATQAAIPQQNTITTDHSLQNNTKTSDNLQFAARTDVGSGLAFKDKHYIKEDRDAMDLFYGIVLDLGLPLTLNHRIEEIDGIRVYRTSHSPPDVKRCMTYQQQMLFDDGVSEEAPKEDSSGDATCFIACFADRISENLIEKVAKKQPDYAIFMACSLAEHEQANKIFAQYAPNTVIQRL